MRLKEKLNCVKEISIKIIDFCLKYRYLIALIVFITLVACKINFSSVDSWQTYIFGGDKVDGVILGQYRTIRSDEWVVQTPYAISQANADGYFELYNNNIGEGANMILGEAPVFDITILARPLLWGYLLFGEEYGFSWYWSLKMVMLFMVSFELALMLSKKDRILSIAGAIWLALTPGLMWWLSTAIVDSYIFGFTIVILFNYYMNNLDWKLRKKVLIAIAMALAIPAFAFALYPAIQVPFALIMAVFIIGGFVKHWQNLKKQDFIIMGLTIFATLLLIARFIAISWNDIKLMTSTVYPGARFETGGDVGIIDTLAKGLLNIFTPYVDLLKNPCEAAFAYFPIIGLAIVAIYNLKGIKQKIKQVDTWIIIALVLVFILLAAFVFIGLPKILAGVTLLYLSPAKRAKVVLGILGIMLSIIFMKKMSDKKIQIFKWWQAGIISLIVVGIVYIIFRLSEYYHTETLTYARYLIVFAIAFFMTYFFIRFNKKVFCVIMIAVAILAGGTVNPIVRGMDVLHKTELATEIQKVVEQDKEAKWIALNNVYAQYLIANGAKTLNGVNRYPNHKMIDILDPNKEYEEVWNRYAHIIINLGYETKFNLDAKDVYDVTLTYEDLKKLEVKYCYVHIKLDDQIIKDFNLEEVFAREDVNQYIYLIN